ncbi:hypothetical protein ACEQ8H_005781 [Pleosporales sp. CAS-2024a]
MSMSSSPSARRTLQPSPIAPPLAELPSLQPPPPLDQPSAPSPLTPTANRKRKSVGTLTQPPEAMATAAGSAAPALALAPLAPPPPPPPFPPPLAPAPAPPPGTQPSSAATQAAHVDSAAQEPKLKKSRTNTPWTPAEELRLKQMRDSGNSWSEIAKTFPQRTEGSVKKHWYKDMHYAEFAEDEKSAALLAAIKEYDANKWKVIGQKVGKPAKACEQYAKEHFGGKY